MAMQAEVEVTVPVSEERGYWIPDIHHLNEIYRCTKAFLKCATVFNRKKLDLAIAKGEGRVT